MVGLSSVIFLTQSVCTIHRERERKRNPRNDYKHKMDLVIESAPILATPHPVENTFQHAFEPYVNNGGTTVGVAGKDFVVMGADTRLSEGYSIHTRMSSKLIQLTNKCVLASAGMQGDMAALHKTLKIRLEMYKHSTGKEMPTTAIAQLLGNTLYYKRFFPYYAFNVLGGLDEAGFGCVFSYDAVGSFERVRYSASGTGQTLVMPFLDNQIARKNQKGASPAEPSLEETQDIVRDAVNSAGERDIYTGDYMQLVTITQKGVTIAQSELKFD